MKYPRIFPYPISFFKAALLSLVTLFPILISFRFWRFGIDYAMFERDINIVIVSGMIALLLPIFLIAYIHHIIHIFLSKFAPTWQASYMSNTSGIIPGVISWFEAVFTWAIMLIALAATFGIAAATESLFDERLPGLGLLYMGFASYLYHICYLAEEKMTSSASWELSKRP